jgi:tRNA-specific 2-thiouridylase
MAKILVALSGGVDSSVAALKLKEAGHSVSTAYIRTWLNEEMPLADCPAQQDIEDSRSVAKHLKLDYEIVNLVNQYREKVVQYLVEGYRKGLTPNPDIMCNREMKFGLFQDYALEQGFDAIATGHYVRKVINPDGTQDLLEGIDKNKDQSYFLALLSQKQLQKAEFPIGHLKKSDVRTIAQNYKLPNSEKKDSQGICFLGNMNINQFLEHYIEDSPGPIINHEDKILGEHKGLHRFTVGQRRGIGVPSNTDNEAYVVTRLDFQNNALYVAFDKEDSPYLYASESEIEAISYINKPIETTAQLLAKPRYRDPSQTITFTPKGHSCAHVQFATEQRALAEGQVIAFYENEKLLGGGFYSKIHPQIIQ